MPTLDERKQKLLNFKGAMAAPFTPFDANGEVDVSQIPKYLKHYLDSGVDGVYIVGTTGEGYSLTNDERLAVAKAWRQAIDAQQAYHLLAVVNVSSTCMKESTGLAKQIEQLGFDGIAVLPPNYYRPQTIGEWVDYMKTFDRAAPNTPLYYYHNATRIGEMSFDIVDAIGEGLKQIPQFCGLKFADTNFQRFMILLNKHRDQLNIFMAYIELLVPALASGCLASNAALLNYPHIVAAYKQMIVLVGKGDIDGALREQHRIVEETYRHKETGNYFHSIKTTFNKHVAHLGLDVGLPRPPIYYHYEW